MRICAISDQHGFLPEIPDCDLLVIGGDISPMQNQQDWWIGEFLPWLMELAARRIVVIGIAGNHDFIIQERGLHWANEFPWIYLQDSGIELGGVKFWGTPWQKWFGGWAFNAPENDHGEEFLEEKFRLIPADTDVVIAHTPPVGILDRVGRSHVGSVALNRHIQRVTPTLCVFGHIHVGYGVETVEGVTLCNAALTDTKTGEYVLNREPFLFDV